MRSSAFAYTGQFLKGAIGRATWNWMSRWNGRGMRMGFLLSKLFASA